MEKLPDVDRSSPTANHPPSIDLAQESTLIDSLPAHDTSGQPKPDRTSVPRSPVSPFQKAPSTVLLPENCPRIDLIALVREKQKTKKVPKQKLLAPREELHRRVEPRGPSSESFR